MSAQPALSSVPRPAREPGAPRVLVVDDEESLRQTFEVFLAGAGFEVASSGSAAEALALVGAHHFDAVIADIVMPGGDGIALLRAVREADPERPVILMTGNPSLTSATEAVRGGAFDYLAKPVKKDQLLQAVRRAVDRYQLIEEKRRLQELTERQAQMLADNVRQLEGLSVAKDRLTALLVHDFKNPLSAIISNLSLLKRYPLLAENNDVRECLADASEASAGLLRMITMLLDISRMEESAMQLHLADVTLGEVIEGSLAGFRAMAAHRKVRVEVGGAPDEMVLIDRMLIERVLANLVANGLRYAPRGGFIRVTGRSDAGRVEIVVENNGPTIPTAMRKAIFDKYGQVEGIAERAPVTRGLGLYFCRLAVEAHGGTISVEDVPSGDGVRFLIELPRD